MPPRDFNALRLPAGGRASIFDLFRRPPRGEVTYSVAPIFQAAIDRRTAPRRRTRLRSGKILDRGNRFLVEAAIIDRSSGGLRLRLARNCDLPENFHLFDDESETIYAARQIWRRQAMIGARLRPGGPVPATRRQIIELRGKFYAIAD